MPGMARRYVSTLLDARPATAGLNGVADYGLWQRYWAMLTGITPAAHGAREYSSRTAASPVIQAPPRANLVIEKIYGSGTALRRGDRERGGRRRLLVPVAAALSVLAIAFFSFAAGELLGGRHVVNDTAPSLIPYAVLSGQGSLSAEDVAFSPDGTDLAVADLNGTTYLWQLITGNLIARLLNPGSRGIAAVAFSPNGKSLAAGGRNGSTYLWNLATGKRRTTFRCAGSGGISAVAFSPDGKTLAAGGSSDRGLTCVWDPVSGVRLARLRDGGSGIGSVAFSPDGKILAVGDRNGSTYLWKPSAVKLLGQLRDPGQSGVGSVAFSPDGKILAVGDRNGSTYLWNLATRKQGISAALSDPGRSGGVNAVAFGPAGKTIATADGNGSTYLRDLATGKLLAVLADPGSDGVNAAAFSPDGTTLATADRNGQTYLWKTPAPLAQTAQGEATAVSNLVTSSASSRLSLINAFQDALSCTKLSHAASQFQQVRNERQSELNQAERLSTRALPNGAALKSDLTQALQYSLDADNDYLQWAEHQQASCQAGSQPKFPANSIKANLYKKLFARLWNPIASQYGLLRVSAANI
jgi:WD40 repeat protein